MMVTCSSNLHPFYGFCSKRKKGIPLPTFREEILDLISLGLLLFTYLSAGRKDISSAVITCPPGSHEGSGVVLQGKAAVDGKQISTTSSLGCY